MRIGALSRRTGVSVRLLRYYEEQGLISPRRRPSGYREYREEDVHVVRNIRTLLAAGLGTAAIAELLPCMEHHEGEDLAAACSGTLAGLHRERERITRAVDELLTARSALDRVITTTPKAVIEDPGLCLAEGPAPADRPETRTN
ncbi:MerR family transcriptional regulator [Streptomyces sp. NPDC003077]|uniref:MerR family transcriptional regulator n=1 Tax=Streptomyces sp. NPDC003077 TaxID=3154443 RepID=UPI0033BAE988